MKAELQTEHGVYTVDLETEEVLELDEGATLPEPEQLELTLPLLLAAAASGPTVVALLDRRPPLAVSHDGGVTWRESGAGLPRGVAVAIAADDPDFVLFAARNRVYRSVDGGRFWQALTLELPEITGLRLV
jgi:hypothetical protein